jgi:dipeptidyl aminopeptidase/acylaminoacyl peptidase
MPWDQTELWVAPFAPDGTIGAAARLAGGDGESVTQPRWSPAGSLHFISDRSGWWNLYDETGTALAPMEAEFAGPDWVFGLSSYAFTPDHTLVATWDGPDGASLGLVDRGHVTPLALPFSAYSSLQATPGGVVAVAGSPTEAPAVVRIGLDEKVEVVRRSRETVVDPGYVSAPRRVDFPTGGGATAHAWFYAPVNADFSGPATDRPPLVVTIHGGPTSAAMPVLNLGLQYWTSCGFAVADVDYRGSSGYGRAYRDLLQGTWGVADVEDCAAVVAWLAEQGWIDGSRAVIRGGSAGGFTTLAALAFTDAFAAGASLYGVADLELLARDTHKFEARYLDRLVGPYPEAAAIYRERSPIHHVEQISRPVILFQGLEDAVVPPAQSELMYQALAGRGVPVAYLAFEGEQHGFRQAATIRRVAEAELAFYGRVLGFEPPDAGAPVLIANDAAL